jgi:kynurenine formamidase
MKKSRLVDLTFPLYTGAPIWSPEPKTVIADYFTIGRHYGATEQLNMKVLYMAGHAGTHCDAPIHLRAGRPTLDEVPLERYVGPASVVHLPHKGFADPWIMIADLEHLAPKLGEGSRLLVHTGWDRFWEQDNQVYFDQQKAPKLHLETLAWLRDRKVGLIGVDMPSVNALLDQHATVFDAEMPPTIVELLTNLGQLPEEVELICLPLRISEGDGSPVRAVALVEEG